MKLYTITFNGRKWQTTDYGEAIEFMFFMGFTWYGKKVVSMTNELYIGPEIKTIQSVEAIEVGFSLPRNTTNHEHII